MAGKRSLEKTIKSDDWSNATINVHITKSDKKQFRFKGDFFAIVNPNRIGIDFDNFEDGSHYFIPNVTTSDLIQIINRIEILSYELIRKALREGKIRLTLGVELTSRRRVDFEIGYSPKSGNEELRMYYEDPGGYGILERFQIGRIDVRLLKNLMKALKEILVEYNHYMNRALLLKETV